MADTKTVDVKTIARVLLLVIAAAGIAYGGYLMGTGAANSLPFFLVGAMAGALSAVLGGVGKSGPK